MKTLLLYVTTTPSSHGEVGATEAAEYIQALLDRDETTIMTVSAIPPRERV